MNDKYAALDRIMRRDPGNRGLLSALESNPVMELRESLNRAERVLLLTGFPVRLLKRTAPASGERPAAGEPASGEWPAAGEPASGEQVAVGETDGPSGTANIAWALEQTGAQVRALTDKFSIDQLTAAMKARGCRTVPEMLPDNEDKRQSFLEELFQSFMPTHFLTLERPGKGEDGHYHTMRGIVIDDIVTDSQQILPMARQYGAETIAVGDGGNELGMGSLRPLVVKSVPLGSKICDSGECDIALVAGVSNWWGWAIAALLSDSDEMGQLLSDSDERNQFLPNQNGRNLLPSDQAETNMLEAVIASGGVDGCTARPELTVDDLSLQQHLEVLRAVREWVVNSHKEESQQAE